MREAKFDGTELWIADVGDEGFRYTLTVESRRI